MIDRHSAPSTPEQTSAAHTHTAPRRTFLRHAVGAAIIVPAGLLASCSSSGGDMTNAAISATSQPVSTASPLTGQTPTPMLQPIGQSKPSFTEIMNDESQHVQFLQGALKNAARPRPTFQKLEQTDVQSFASLARQLENVGVGAYLLTIPMLTNKDSVLTLGSILTIEARHAGFLDALLQKPLSANGAFDKPMTQADIASAITPFIASLNGGTDPAASLNNDTDILNLALLLEFLESELYNLNVTKLLP